MQEVGPGENRDFADLFGLYVNGHFLRFLQTAAEEVPHGKRL